MEQRPPFGKTGGEALNWSGELVNCNIGTKDGTIEYHWKFRIGCIDLVTSDGILISAFGF